MGNDTGGYCGALPPLPRPDARLGLFGGTFDPVHLGHLALARAALGQLQLDRLFFIPAAQAPLREGAPVASASARLDMLRLALADANDPRLGVLDLEARAGGVNYTVDTLRALRAVWPKAKLFWVLGSDQFAQLDQWREPRELARLADFAVLDRPGSPPSKPPAALAAELCWQRLNAPGHPASAAEIRRCYKAGAPTTEWLSRAVAEKIAKDKLYA